MITDYVLSFVMAGGRGSRLKVLTKYRTKPAVGILGHYRIFDFVATNIANTGIPAMLIAAQFQPRSLIRHIGDGRIWGFDGIDKIIEIVQPYEEGREFITFEGTADSVRKNMARINSYNPRIVFVLGGDHIYSTTYEDAIRQHKRNNADVTIMANPIPEGKVSDFGIMKIDEHFRIIDFAEKPKDEELIDSFRLSDRVKSRLGINEPNLNFLGSMGNYIFFRDRLERFLKYPGSDFGNDIIPAIKKDDGSLYAFVFNGYWRDVGKVKDYFACNMEFISETPPISLTRNRIRTALRFLPGPKISANSSVRGSILSAGDEIYSDSVVTNSVLGYQVVVDRGCKLERCVLLGSDRNEFYDNELRRNYITLIGEGSHLECVIFDKNVEIGRNVRISPENGTPEEREEKLKNIGLKPYTVNENGKIEGDFYIEPESNILVIGKQGSIDPKMPILPDGLEC